MDLTVTPWDIILPMPDNLDLALLLDSTLSSRTGRRRHTLRRALKTPQLHYAFASASFKLTEKAGWTTGLRATSELFCYVLDFFEERKSIKLCEAAQLLFCCMRLVVV